MKPILTEKSLRDAAEGKFTFFVPTNWTKHMVKEEIGRAFDVHVRTVKSANRKAETKRNVRGNLVHSPATKKVIVTLKDKEKIDLFDSDKK